MQTTSHILMIRPVNFSFNAETAVNNAFQVNKQDKTTQENAEKEFDVFTSLLSKEGVDVLIVQDTPEPYTPDSIFPNNWISFHSNGTMVLYPMFAVNRRKERKQEVIEQVTDYFTIKQTVDLTDFERQKRFLEGTGSMVLDRDKKIAYACLSPRTDKLVLINFCKKMNYEAVIFDSLDANGKPIYHTNVMMCVADRYVVICLDSIPDADERGMVRDTIIQSGKELIEITPDQMNRFAGNMLQVENKAGEKLLVMSSQAYRSLTPEQVTNLKSFNKIVHAPLDTIETNGGGSARCMMAEVFLPVKK